MDEIVRALGYIVGKKAGAPTGSSVTIELTGPVSPDAPRRRRRPGAGRRPSRWPGRRQPWRWGRVLFTRLACGRVDPAAMSGEVRLSGDAELGQRVVTSLPFTI